MPTISWAHRANGGLIPRPPRASSAMAGPHDFPPEGSPEEAERQLDRRPAPHPMAPKRALLADLPSRTEKALHIRREPRPPLDLRLHVLDGLSCTDLEAAC